MKEISNIKKKNFVKKLFVKVCRIFGYEIIDQSTFSVPTQNKLIGDNLSLPGEKSIVIPLGETKISRKVKALTIIFRSCTNVNMLTQNKKRLFEKNKSEYTFRSLNSIICSLNKAKKKFSKIEFNIIVVDYNSEKGDLDQIKNQLNKSIFNHSIISLNMNDFKDKINKTNAKNEVVTDRQMSNMANIYKSLLIARDECEDLVYLVEDDYIHQQDSIIEMIFSYERIASQINRELILCPADYPYLYTKANPTNIFLGYKRHWRRVEETLCTFLTSKSIINAYWKKFTSMCEFEHYP
jgi:hypothetical protein